MNTTSKENDTKTQGGQLLSTLIPNNTDKYESKISTVTDLIANADRVALGIGSGLSAAGGLNYGDPELVKKWYPEYYSLGVKSIVQLQGMFWWLHSSDPKKYWGFWGQHIYHIRYEASVTQPYIDLYDLVQQKDHFVITTNCDGQVDKAGFDTDRILATQGNYCYFQCSRPCSDELYYNEEKITEMIENMPDPFEIREQDIPLCPKCGAPMVPNLRCDNTFVEKPHMKNVSRYESFLSDGENSLLLLELGVGYNTPVIIRYPFEQLTQFKENTSLVRVNLDEASVPQSIRAKSVTLEADLGKVLHDVRETAVSHPE